MKKKRKEADEWTPEKIEDWPALLAYMKENLVNLSGYNPITRKIKLWDGRTLARKAYLGNNNPDFMVDIKKKDITEGLEVFLKKLLDENRPFVTNGFNLIGKRKYVIYYEWRIIS